MQNQLVSITIPTYNSARTLIPCLDSINKQTYLSIDVNIIDNYSCDETIQIARRFNIKKILRYQNGLLGARLRGITESKGKYILLLDSDQILDARCIEHAVDLCEKDHFDMLAFEEGVFECNNFLQWLFLCDRKVIETEKDINPYTSAILPRFFRASVIKKAIRRIPKRIIPTVGGPDHAIIYHEIWQLTHKISFVPNAVLHMETDSFISFIRKCYRWGYTSASTKTIPKYRRLLAAKESFRKGLFQNGLIIESMASIILLLLKGIPYKLGYIQAKLQKKIV